MSGGEGSGGHYCGMRESREHPCGSDNGNRERRGNRGFHIKPRISVKNLGVHIDT